METGSRHNLQESVNASPSPDVGTEAPPLDWEARYREAVAARESAEAQVRHLTAVVEGIGDGFVTFDNELRYQYVNPYTLRLMRQTHEEIIGRAFHELYPTLLGSEFDLALQRALRENCPVEADLEWSGDGRYWRTYIYPTGSGVSVFFRDITDVRSAEIAQQRLAAIVASSDDAIIGKTLEGIITTWNAGAERIFGYTAEEVMGKPKTILFPQELLAEEAVILKRLAQGIPTVHAESVRVRKDGTRINVSLTVSPIRDGSGQIVGASTIARDITSHKRLEGRLREETETLETLYRFGQRLAAELDLEKLVQMATDTATQLTGAQFGAFFYNVVSAAGESYTLYTISGVPREQFSQFPMPRNTPVFAPTFHGEGTILSGNIQKDPRYGQMPEYKGMPQGHLPVVSYLAVPVVSRSGEVLGGLFFGHEHENVFTERHARIVEGIAGQAAVAIDNARLFQAERERSEQLRLAVREVHHRVKNSLQGVSALLEMQLEPGSNTLPVEAVADSLGQIKTIALVHDLLAHDQPVGEVNVAEVLHKLAGMLGLSLGTPERRAKIHLEADPVSMPVRCAIALALVVNELITNAAKHTLIRQDAQLAAQDEQRHDCRIEVRLQYDGETALLSVEDNGPGFPPDFTPLLHAHIGLDLVQTLVTNDLRGRVTFRNRTAERDSPDLDGCGARVEIAFVPANLSD